MPLESASYITDLVPTNPLGTDQRSSTDDHLRLLKTVLLAQFPNLNAAVTPTPAEINKLTGLTVTAAELEILAGALITVTQLNYLQNVTSDIQAQLDANVGQMLGLAAVRTFFYGAQVVSEDITVPVDQNAMAPGPITIADTFTLTISNGSTLTIV